MGDRLPEQGTAPSSPGGLLPVTVDSMQEADVVEVAALHRKAFSGYLNTQLGSPYVQASMQWFVQAEPAVAFVARDRADCVLGYIVGAPQGYGRSLNQAVWPQAVAGLLGRPWLLLQRRMLTALWGRLRVIGGRPSSRPAPDLPAPVMSLVGIGVAPSAQGRRIGSRLMEAFEQQARLLGTRALRLSVYASNNAARGLYEKQGWQPYRPNEIAHHGALYYYKLLEEPSPS